MIPNKTKTTAEPAEDLTKVEHEAEEQTESDDERKEELLEEARRRYRLGTQVESEIRADFMDDMDFYDDNQWDAKAKANRERDNRPVITVNRVKQFVRNVTNEQRQQRPSIRVNPVDDRADPGTAKVMSGMIRHIEYDSHADQAYDTAGFHAVTMGRGYLRVITEYCDHDSFDQQLKIKRITDPLSVLVEPDTEDPSWGFVVETITKEAFKAQFPKAKLFTDSHGWQLGVEAHPGWVTEDSIMVAEYFYREEEADELLMLADGTTVFKSEWDKKGKVLRRRDATKYQWKWAKLTADEVLEETDWLGKWLPIVEVLGDEYIANGKKRLRGVVHDAKDAQRIYNFMVSNELELISLMPKAPWIAAEGQIEGYEKEWRDSNLRAVPVLQYKATDVNGNQLPAPQRQNIDPNIGALSTAKMQAADDMKAATGIYDASLGARSNETSGRAILARQQQSQTTNYHYIDNLTRAIRKLGRILVDLIPKVYDTPRVINITGEDGETELVAINKLFIKDGVEVQHMLDLGKYDVVITTGPSYATKRQEAVDSFLALAQSAPQLMQIAPDIVINNMDFPGAQEIAARFRKTLPPNLTEDGKANAEVQLAQATQAVQQMQQQLQAINAHAQQVEQELAQVQGKAQSDEARLMLDAKRLELEGAKVALEVQRFELEKELKVAEAALNYETTIAELAMKEQQLNIKAVADEKRLAFEAIKHDDNLQQQHHDNVLGVVAELNKQVATPDEVVITED